jgi:hypothetical protein
MSSKHNDTFAQIKTCIYLPPRVNSQKPWFQMADTRWFLGNSLPVLQIQMCLIFFGTLFFKSILCRFGIPKFTSMSIVSPIITCYITNMIIFFFVVVVCSYTNISYNMLHFVKSLLFVLTNYVAPTIYNEDVIGIRYMSVVRHTHQVEDVSSV